MPTRRRRYLSRCIRQRPGRVRHGRDIALPRRGIAFAPSSPDANLSMSSTSTFFGWRVVGAAFVLAMFAWGISFYGPPVFLQALHAGKGWPVTLVSAAITTHFLLGALVVARFAALQQRLVMVR